MIRAAPHGAAGAADDLGPTWTRRKPKLARLPPATRQPMPGPRERLKMFLIALTLAAVEPPPRPMEVEVVRDPITDQVRAFATIRSGRDRLVVSCDRGGYDGARISFHAAHWLARGNVFTGERPVVHRFDDLPPRRTMWDIDNRRGTLAGRARVNDFLAN